MVKKIVKLNLRTKLPSVVRSDSIVWLYDYRELNFVHKFLGGFFCGDAVAARGRNLSCGVKFFHVKFIFPARDLFRPDSACNVKVTAQAGVAFKPILVVGFNPIDAAILKCKEGHGAIHFVVVFHVVDKIIFGKAVF